MKCEEHPNAVFKEISCDNELEFQRRIQKRKIPRCLFKYKSIKGTLDFLENSMLLYSHPSLFNDPFDCMANVQTQRTSFSEWYRRLTAIGTTPGAANFFLHRAMIDTKYGQDFVRNSIESAKEKFGILCLSAKNDDILMWSHYSDNHKGICVEFDISCDSKSFYIPQKVKYSNKYPKFNFIKNPNLLTKALCQKSKQWEYEDEYRIIKADGYGLHTVKNECIKSIIFGCKIEEEDEIIIRQKVKDNNFNVKFRRAVQDDKSYKLNIIDVE